jgi:hypothetical protein
VWQSEHPATNEAPLLVSQLVSPQTATNGVNEISWNTSSTATLYIEAISNGAATLTYTFIGTGSAEGINRRASLKITVWKIEPDEMDVNWRMQNTALNLTSSGCFGSNGVVWKVGGACSSPQRMGGENSAAGQCETLSFAAIISQGELQAPPTLFKFQ